MEKTDITKSTNEKQDAIGNLNSEKHDQKHNIKRRKLERPFKNKNAIAKKKCKLCGSLSSVSHVCSEQSMRGGDEEKHDTALQRRDAFCRKNSGNMPQLLNNKENDFRISEDTTGKMFASKLFQYTDNNGNGKIITFKERNRDSYETEKVTLSKRSQNFCQKDNSDLCDMLNNTDNNQHRTSEETTKHMGTCQYPSYKDDKRKDLKIQLCYHNPLFPME